MRRVTGRPSIRIATLPALLLALLYGCGNPPVEAGQPISPQAPNLPDRPNIVLIFADDLGYGDLSSYGHPTIVTPRLDQMAREGLRFTSFYSAAPVCTPSRAALLTGRHAIRSGLSRVLFPSSQTGLPQSEVTLAQLLKDRGYRTAAIGKWHLGHLPRFLPTAHGFDSYLGIPYSNDMDNLERGDPATIPLMRDTLVVEESVDQTTLTRRYTEEAIEIMRESAGRQQPFFVYLAHSMPHLPLFASADFLNTSRAGIYGDVIEELDASVGDILDEIASLGLDRKTVVIFTSDNGPWLNFGERYERVYGSRPWHGGSAGHLREGKSSTYEGGVRVPAVIRWPGVIPAAGLSAEMATTMDLLPTFARLAGAQLPDGLTLDGNDLTPLLLDGGRSPTQEFFYFRAEELEGVRQGRWKLRLSRHLRPELTDTDPIAPELFDLELDPSERYNVAAEHPEIVARLRQRMESVAVEVGATTVAR